MRDQENMDVDSLAKRIASDIDVLSDLPSLSPVVARLSATLGDDDVEVRTIALDAAAAGVRRDPGSPSHRSRRS